MKKKIFIILTAAILILSGFSATGKGNYELVEDFYGVISEDEKIELRNLAEEVSKKHSADVVIAVVDSLDGKTATEYADDYYDYNYFGQGENKDGILLILSMEYRDYAISTTGFGIKAFTDKGLSYIEDKILPKLGDDDYYKAFKIFIELSDKFLTQAETGKPYDVGNMPKRNITPISAIITALISGGISSAVGGGYVANLKSAHKTKIRRNTARGYQSGIVNITNKNDIFANSNVTRRLKPQAPPPSSGGGGSTTHVGSSGTTHGGSSGKF